MARLKSVLPVRGTVGNLTFAHTADGIIVKSKSTVSGARIAASPEYARTRENNTEFANAGSCARLMYRAFEGSMCITPDNGCYNRLSARMLKLLQSDPVGARGKRKVHHGDAHILEGFEFNASSTLHERLYKKPQLNFDTGSGTISASYSAFFPDCILNPPKDATHFSLTLSAVRIDFGSGTWTIESRSSEMIAIKHDVAAPLNLTVPLPPGEGGWLMAALGLEFYELVHRTHCPMEKGKLNAMGIVLVDEML